VRVSVFIATSLDGFIARTDGSLDWLDQANATVPPGEDFGFQEFMDSVDVLIMGRKTFEKVLSFSQWPYGNKPVIVMSRRGIQVPAGLDASVSVTSEKPEDLYKRFVENGLKRLYIDGGLTIRGFLSAKLISDLTITVIPVLLGSGIRLFAEDREDIDLKLISNTAASNGFVQLKYETKYEL